MATPPEVYVHPSGLCESDAVGAGTRVWAFAHVLPGARIGRDCNVCDHAFVEGGAVVGDRVTVKNGVAVFEGVTVGDDVFLGPNMTFTNDLMPRSRTARRSPYVAVPTVVGEGATVGANATIVCGSTIGAWAFVGAGAVVTRPVPPHAVVRGNPARISGWMCKCGTKLGDGLICECGLAYERAGEGLAEAR